MKQTTSSHSSVVVDKDKMERADPRVPAALLSRPALTAHEIAAILGMSHAPDAVKRLRRRKYLRVTIVGETKRPNIRPEKLYRIELAENPSSSGVLSNPEVSTASSVPHDPESVSGLARQAAEKKAAQIVDEHLDEMMSPREYAETRQALIKSIADRGVKAEELRSALQMTLAAMRKARDEWPNYQPDVQWVTAWDAARAALAGSRDEGEQKPEDQKLG